jgi:hypothetical protein
MFAKMNLLARLTLLSLALFVPPSAMAQSDGGQRFIPANQSVADKSTSDQTIPLGTQITTQNWQSYRKFMSDGMQALFSGKYFWKMPDSAEIVVGPTRINPPPKTFMEATEKYSSQVKLIELPDGSLTISGYRGGFPFPIPDEPHRGWKILANLWYRYFPHISVINHGGGCSIDRTGNINCAAGDIVYRQLSYNTDPGVPETIPGGEGKYFTQWYMLSEPEQQRYTASLQIVDTDLTHNEALYAFIPSLRRYQPVSTLARCGTTQGVDITEEDYRSGFDSNLSDMKVDFLGERKVLTLLIDKMPDKGFPDSFVMPLGWPQPSWGQWQVRDTYVISVSKLPSEARGYCYGKRVMYVDKTTFAPYWEELCDAQMRAWKIVGLFLHTINLPDIGPVETSGSLIYAFWDIQNDHASFVMDPTNTSYAVYWNSQVPADYLDLTRYSTPGGLNMIMR